MFRKFRKYEFRKVSQILVSQFYACFARFARFLTHILFSTAESSSLRDPHGISTGKTSLCPAGDKGTIPLESPALCPHPQLLRGAPRRACRLLCGRPCPRRPPQAAALCLPAPPSRRPVTVRSVRHCQKGTTQVLSVIRRRALATVADCGISMWLP